MTSLTSKGWSGESLRSSTPVVPPYCKRRARYIKVILLGDMCVGKTSLLTRFVQRSFREAYLPTFTVDYSEREVTIDDKAYLLQIMDTAGQERFKSLTANFYRGTQICLLTFSLDSLGSFCSLSRWREEFIQFSCIDRALDFPFVVVGNKADLDAGEKTVKNLTVQAWCEANGNIPYIETSAKTGEHVDELFMTALKRLIEMEKQKASPLFQQGGGLKLDPTAQSRRKRPKCCD